MNIFGAFSNPFSICYMVKISKYTIRAKTGVGINWPLYPPVWIQKIKISQKFVVKCCDAQDRRWPGSHYWSPSATKFNVHTNNHQRGGGMAVTLTDKCTFTRKASLLGDQDRKFLNLGNIATSLDYWLKSLNCIWTFICPKPIV